MRRLFIAFVIACCAIQHHVRLLLGPNEDTASAGFLCKDPLDESQYLFARAYAQGHLTFQLVVDLVDLGGDFPSCLAEDIRAQCHDETGPCTLAKSVAPQRFCTTVDAAFDTAQNPAKTLMAYLHDTYPSLIADTTDRPVIVRAVATTQPCSELMQTSAVNPNAWVVLDSDSPSSPTAQHVVLGCAYSCPVLLDQVGDQISLGLDLGLGSIDTQQCISTIDACARFPAP